MLGAVEKTWRKKDHVIGVSHCLGGQYRKTCREANGYVPGEHL